MSAELGALIGVALMVAVNIATVAFFLGGLRSEIISLAERVTKLEKRVFDL